MIYFLVFCLIVILFLEYVSQYRDLSGLEVDLDSSKRLVEPGEEFDLLLDIRNPGWLVYPFFSVDLNLPEGFCVLDGRMRFSCWLLPRQRVSMKIPCVIHKRGRWLGRHIRLYSGDFLGVSGNVETEFAQYVDVVCMPKQAEPAALSKLPGDLYGSVSVNRFLFEDPILSIGYRDYTGREPQKQISWKQSARMGRLMVRQYDYTEDASVLVAVNAQAAADEEGFETCFSLARSVCEKLESMGVMYSFCTNSITEGDIHSWNYVSSGLGTQHLTHVLEGLGRCSYRCSVSLETMLARTLSARTNTFAMIFITPGGEEETCRRAETVARHYGVDVFCARPADAAAADAPQGREEAV